MKKLVVLLGAVAVTGCATHANIEMPVVTQVYHSEFDNKTFGYEILYSQPKPGLLFAGGEQMPMVPLSQAELSIASARTLKKLPDYIFDQLPSTVKRAEDNKGQYTLKVELTAHDKLGPTYADYEFTKSLVKGILTLGFGSFEYDIVADFDVRYELYSGDSEISSKSYSVTDFVDHETSRFDMSNPQNGYASTLLEKHLILTLNDFFTEVKTKH